MKLMLAAFTALVALATVNCHYLPDFGKGPLHEDIQYFLDMIPLDDVAGIVLEYAAEDREFNQLLMYMRTNDFKRLVMEMEAIPQFHEFITYLQNNGVYMYDVMNMMNKGLGLPSYKPMSLFPRKITGGLKGLFNDVKSLISYDLFIHGYVFKMRTSPAFRGFVAQLKSQEHQKFVNNLYANQDWLKFRNMISSKGIDVALIEDIIYTVLGVEFPDLSGKAYEFEDTYETALSKDIHDFIHLIDKDKVLEIVFSFLEDEQVQQAINYMYNEEFHALVRKVEALKEYQGLIVYLTNAGLNVVDLIQKIHAMLGMEPYDPPAMDVTVEFVTYLDQINFVNRGGVKALVEAVKAVLPLKKIRAMYDAKMVSSPAFKNFILKIRAPEFTKIVDTIYATPIFQEMRNKALAVGLDLKELDNILKNVIGIDLPDV